MLGRKLTQCAYRPSASSLQGQLASQDGTTASDVADYGLHPIMICQAPSGTNTFDLTLDQTTSQEYDILDFDVTAGQSDQSLKRIIALGFEVLNTTADINKQGSVTCYSQPCKVHDNQVTVTPFSTSVANGSVGCGVLAAPPNTLSEAKSMADSVSWAAREGAYAIPQLGSMPSPSIQRNGHLAMISTLTGNGGATVAGIAAAPLIPGTATMADAYSNCYRVNEFNRVGAYFSGLSPETTLTVVLHAYIEVFPSPDDDFRLLASPSAPYDPLAWRLYTETIRQMPPACQVQDNASGDWFRRALSVLKGSETFKEVVQMLPGASLGEAVARDVAKMASLPKVAKKAAKKELAKQMAKGAARVSK